jgi:hypothetical protein
MQWFYQLPKAGYLHEDKLSDKLRYYLTPMLKFRQFADIKEAFGKGQGDTVDFRLITNVKTGGRTMGLLEHQLMPEDSFRIKTDQLCLKEYGNSIPFTGKAKVLSKWDVEDIIRKLLARDAANVIDSAVEMEFDQTLVRYVGVNPIHGHWFRNGWPGTGNGHGLHAYHVKEMIDDLVQRDVPTYDGDDYVCLGTTFALRHLKDELEPYNYYTQDGRKPILNGEIGRYYKCRFVEVNHGMSAAAFVNGHSSEAYFFGADTVMEAIAVPEEVRVKETSDYRRRQGLAWYLIAGWKLQWGDRRDADSDWRQSRIIKWDSGTGSNSRSISTYSRSYNSYHSESESLGWCISQG